MALRETLAQEASPACFLDFEIERFEHNGFTVVLYQDPEPLNPRPRGPRKDYDHMATFACWSRDYDLGDKRIARCTLRELVQNLNEKILAAVPLSFAQFGTIGWAYVTESDARKMGCDPGATYKDGDGVECRYDSVFFEGAIEGEHAEYQAYLNNEVYGYEILDADGDHLDSCWGFIADLDYARQQGREAAEHAESVGRVHGGCDATCADDVEGAV